MTLKYFLLMIALTLLVGAGQASAQGPSVSLRHVPDAGGTEGIISGPGTTFTVRVSQTGVNDIPGIANAARLNIDFAFDTSVVNLTTPIGFRRADNATGTTLTLIAFPRPTLTVPDSVDLTFTTSADYDGSEFTIEITGVSSTGIAIPLSEKLTFNSVRPLPLDPQLHLDTQIESPAQNNSVLTFTDKRPGDTLQIQLFVPNVAGQDIQAFTLELALQGKTFADFISSISGSDWTGGDLFPGTSASNLPTLSGLFLNAAPVPMTGYLGQIDLEVIGVLSDQDKLRVTSAFLAVAGGALQSMDVSDVEVSFAPICPGDFDDNGIVNMADFMLFEGVFGTRSSDAAYNALMDMDSSGGIDVADFMLFVDVFDTTCKQQPPGDGGGGQTGVSIPDANLRAVIEDSLSKASGAPITQAEMASLRRLEAPDSDIGDLIGLEFAIGLTDLGLYSNSISDLSPLSNLTNLTWLRLSSNSISDLSPLSNLTNLTWLSVHDNDLSGELPSPLGNLTNLRHLEVGWNRLSGELPSWLGNFTNLEVLILSNNQFSGSLPSWLGNLTNMRLLYLSDNNFSGALPLSLVNLRLESLFLDNTQLCVPTDAAFQTWLEGIENKRGVVNCADESSGSGTPKMYWTDHVTDKIQRANLDGSGVEDLVTGLSSPTDLDLGNGGFYWTDYGTGKIQRANLDGSGVEDLITSGLRVPSGIALDMGNGKMYWTDVGTDKIQRANLDGSGVEDLVTGLDHPHRIALDMGNGKMYWTDGVTDKIQRANLDGSGVEDLVVSGLNDPVGIALDLDNSKMYWTDLRALKIQRANLDGSGVEDLVTGLEGYPDGIALDLGNGKMYWTTALTGKIQRANLDGSGVEDLVTGLGNPHGIVLNISGDSGSTSVTIPDANLRAVIEDKLGKARGALITPSEMASLTSLDVPPNSNISDLTGLEFATGLNSLDLGINSISDVSALSNLTNLTVLSMNNNSILDVSALSGLTNLTVLSMNNNSILDVSALSNLTNLTNLYLGGNRISDVSALSGLTNLTWLELGSNSISDVSVLPGLTNLTWLSLGQNSISDVSSLSSLTNLRGLFLDGNQLTGSIPSWLGSLTNLQRLGLSDNAGLSGLLPGSFTSLANLQYLYLADTGLCAPTDAAFQAWLEGIENKSGVVNCGGGLSGPDFAKHVIDDVDRLLNVEDLYGLDLDADGDLDILTGGANADVHWHENDGGVFTQRLIFSAGSGRRVYPADVDGDGDADVLSAAWSDDKIAWHENDGSGVFVERVISTNADGAQSVHAADLDGDGDADVLSASSYDDKIAWYENDGGVFVERVISTDADRAEWVHAADVDGDGDADVLYVAWEDHKIAWYENDGGGVFVERVISTDFVGPYFVHAADLDGDGDADVLSASAVNRDAEIAWYENDGGVFEKRVISTNTSAEVHTADLDGDGDADVLFASSYDDKIAWYENDGGGVFVERVVSTVLSLRGVGAADLDGDGDLDVLSASGGDEPLAWHENLSNHGDDHGDAPDAATLATALPAFLHGVLESAGDRDVFRVATGSGTLRVYSNGPTNTYGTLLDANGAVMAGNDDSGAGLNFEIETAVGAGVHYVEVSSYADATTGPYTVSIEFVANRP